MAAICICYYNNNNNNTSVRVYSAVMARSLWEFTRFIRWMQTKRQMAVNPQTMLTDLSCEFACRLPSSTSTVAIYRYYLAQRLILILPSHRG